LKSVQREKHILCVDDNTTQFRNPASKYPQNKNLHNNWRQSIINGYMNKQIPII